MLKRLAANYDQLDAAKVLLENGADPNFENDEGMSAFTYAEDFGYTEFVELLK
ncbi:ankyrin repeat domain-containing protein [Neobacillus driksii]|uniref:ankyrin repeat domain-containing protein n=1 Tax=Neobacillus driksii TaxID=3035913 RepID=UPI0015CB4B6B